MVIIILDIIYFMYFLDLFIIICCYICNMCNIFFCDDLFYKSLKMKFVILIFYLFLVFDIEYII